MPRRYFSQLCTHRRQHEKEQRVDKSGALWVLPVQKAQKTKNTHRPKPNENDDAFNVFRRAALNTPSNIVWFVLLILIDLRAIYSSLCNFLCDSRTMFPLSLPMHITSTAALQQTYTQTICLTELCAGMRGNLIFSCLLEAPAFLASKLRSTGICEWTGIKLIWMGFWPNLLRMLQNITFGTVLRCRARKPPTIRAHTKCNSHEDSIFSWEEER